MEWTKIPTDILTDALQDWELAAILKYQLLFALKEELPTDVIARRHLTDRQLTFIQQYIDSISTRVQQDIDTCNKERKRQKLKYNKNKDVVFNSPVDTRTEIHTETTKADKIRLDKIRLDNTHSFHSCVLVTPENLAKQTQKNEIDLKEKSTKKFNKPTLEEVNAYCQERQNSIDAQRFLDFYECKGWKVGKNPMKDWQAAVRTWEHDSKGISSSKTTNWREWIGSK